MILELTGSSLTQTSLFGSTSFNAETSTLNLTQPLTTFFLLKVFHIQSFNPCKFFLILLLLYMYFTFIYYFQCIISLLFNLRYSLPGDCVAPAYCTVLCNIFHRKITIFYYYFSRKGH